MSSIKCGRCHETHESVSEVRACFDGKDVPGTAPVVGHDPFPNRYPGPCKLCGSIVEPQTGHIKKVNGNWVVFHNTGDCVAKIPVPQEAIDGIKEPNTHLVFPDVPAGHYAIKSLTGNNDLDFLRVDRPTEGQWAGYTFVKRVIGGKPDSRVRGAKHINKILRAILDAGTDAAMALYGQEIGQCGRCNKHLTDELSRSLGIGPVCRKPKS